MRPSFHSFSERALLTVPPTRQPLELIRQDYSVVLPGKLKEPLPLIGVDLEDPLRDIRFRSVEGPLRTKTAAGLQIATAPAVRQRDPAPHLPTQFRHSEKGCPLLCVTQTFIQPAMPCASPYTESLGKMPAKSVGGHDFVSAVGDEDCVFHLDVTDLRMQELGLN